MKRLLVVLLAAALLSGCKKPEPLARADAQNILQTALFSGPRATQTLDFLSGSVASQPFALNQFLYAKHWLDCSATSPGTFTTSAVCRLNAQARTYGAGNGWSSHASNEPVCERCEVVAVPVATARLTAVNDVEVADAAHATVGYSYTVVPSEIGLQLAAWMASHALAWCGPDPAARGGWNAPRSVRAAFVRSSAGWLPEPPPGADFAAAFGPPGAAQSGKPCSGS